MTKMTKMTKTCRANRVGFTLIELIVVVSIIGLLTVIALPTAVALLSSGSDAQAYNLLCGHLALARAIAVENGTFAGVHVQMADPVADPNLADTCFIAIVWIDPSSLGDAYPKFTLADRTRPKKIPGGIAFGGWNILHEPNYIWTDSLTASEGYFVEDPDGSDITVSVKDFTTFTIIFSPAGSIITKVNDRNIVFDDDPDDPLFGANAVPKLWDHVLTYDMPEEARNNPPQDDDEAEKNAMSEPGATIVTLFEYAKFMISEGDPDSQNAFLDENAQYLPINLHTGQPFRRQ